MKAIDFARKLYLAFIAVLLVAMAHVIYTGIQMHIREANSEKLINSATPYSRRLGNGQSVLILGDSLAYGVGASSPENSFAGRAGALFPDHDIINKSDPGGATQQLADSVREKVDGRYEIAFVIIGGNDIIRYGIDLEVSKVNLAQIVAVTAGSSGQVYLITSSDFANVGAIPWVLSSFYSGRSAEIRAAAQNIADRHDNVDYIDVFDIDPDFYATLEADDKFHLNDKGAEWLVEVISNYRESQD